MFKTNSEKGNGTVVGSREWLNTLRVQRSVFRVKRSVLNVPCSVFRVRLCGNGLSIKRKKKRKKEKKKKNQTFNGKKVVPFWDELNKYIISNNINNTNNQNPERGTWNAERGTWNAERGTRNAEQQTYGRKDRTNLES